MKLGKKKSLKGKCTRASTLYHGGQEADKKAGVIWLSFLPFSAFKYQVYGMKLPIFIFVLRMAVLMLQWPSHSHRHYGLQNQKIFQHSLAEHMNWLRFGCSLYMLCLGIEGLFLALNFSTSDHSLLTASFPWILNNYVHCPYQEGYVKSPCLPRDKTHCNAQSSGAQINSLSGP